MDPRGNQPYPYGQQGYYPPPPRSGVPVWVWVLVVLAILGVLFVGLLAAVLFPVFSQARAAAQSTQCLSNIKQLGTGAMMYAQDYDGELPAASSWMEGIAPYAPNQRAYRCPLVPEGSYGYAYNRAMSRVNLMKLPSPQSSVLLYESSNLSRDATDSVSSLPSPPRHRRGNNIVYADGHAMRSLSGTGSYTPYGSGGSGGF